VEDRFRAITRLLVYWTKTMSGSFTPQQTKWIKGLAYFFLVVGLLGLLGLISEDLLGYSLGVSGSPAPLIVMAFCGGALLWMVQRNEEENK